MGGRWLTSPLSIANIFSIVYPLSIAKICSIFYLHKYISFKIYLHSLLQTYVLGLSLNHGMSPARFYTATAQATERGGVR